MANKILLIVSGSVAAYKSLELVRRLRGEGMVVTGILTAGGKEFITPLAVSSVTGTPTYDDLFSLKDETEMGHIRLSREHDLIVVAPASADFIAKIAHGRADDLAAATLLATDKPVLVAPAMNHRMWEHRATRRNITQLHADGIEIIPPERGEMACGEEGVGRLAEVETIFTCIRRKLSASSQRPLPGNLPLAGRRALVTAGPTQEAIDPVRFISNHSSGRQGYAIAEALAQAGAEVTLISGPTALHPPEGVKLVAVRTAQEMYSKTMHALPADIAICTAAVSDWTIASPSAQKIKKTAKSQAPVLTFSPTRDILAEIAKHPQRRPALVVGFAAETELSKAGVQAKRQSKGCDWMLANDVSHGRVFDAQTTQLLFVDAQRSESWPSMSKREAARRLTEMIAQRIQPAPPVQSQKFPKNKTIAVEELSNKSTRVRYLASQGIPRPEIARQLGIHSSHVSEALKSSERKQAATKLEIGLAGLKTTPAKIRRMYDAGIIPSRIAKRLGIPPEAVDAVIKEVKKKKTVLRRAKRKSESRPQKQRLHPVIAPQAVELIRNDPRFPNQTARIRYMAELGMSRSEIARALGIRYQTVRNALIPQKRNPKKGHLSSTG